MKTLCNGDTFTQNGETFRVNFEHDADAGYPQDNCDGHGKVRRSNYAHTESRSDKKPGERPLNNPGRNEYQFYYDWADACKQAKKDGWNTPQYDAPNRVERAVKADFEFLRGFLNNDWEYVGVIVSRLDSNGEETGETESLCGVETFRDYHNCVALELAQSIIDYGKSRESIAEQFYVGM